MHSDVFCVVLPSEENVEGTDCSLHCGAPVGLSMWVPVLLCGSTDVEISSSIRFYCCPFGNASVCRIDLLSIQQSRSCHVGPWYENHAAFIGLIGANFEIDLEKRQHWFSEKNRKSS
jgi:hypothetical protein